MNMPWQSRCDGSAGQPPASVLVVDDEVGFLETLGFILNEQGYRVDTALGGRAALTKLEQGQYDVVLLDLLMPEVSGLDVLRLLNKRGFDGEVIVISGTTSVTEATAALKHGASDFIAKPFRPQDVLRAVQSAWNTRCLRLANRAMQVQLSRSEELHRLVVTHSPDFIFTLDPDGHFTFVNDRLRELTGYPPEEVLGRPLVDLLVPEDRPLARRVIDQANGFGAVQVAEVRLSRAAPGLGADPTPTVTVTVELSLIRVASANTMGAAAHGQCDRIYGAARDLTEHKRTVAELSRASAQLEHVMSASPAVLYSRDPAAREIAFVSRNLVDLLGYELADLRREGLLGLARLIHADDWERVQEANQRLPKERQFNLEYRMRHRDGGWRWVQDSARLLTDRLGRPLEVVGSWVDNSMAHFLSEQLLHQASHDALTGLANRRAFEQRLNRLLDSAKTEHLQHALCYLDLDQFKVVNDTCGHVAGDSLLRELSHLLQSRIRSGDLLARLGGDEFGLLLESCPLENAERIAEALCLAVNGFRFAWADRSFRPGVSIGVVPINGSSLDAADVLSLADSACYAAKDAGRNRVQVFNRDSAELVRRQGEMEWVARLNQAFEEGLFCLAFQRIVPIRKLQSTTVRHYELLLRIREKCGRLVTPGAFLPAAERYHLSTRVDRWVVENAFAWLGRHEEFRDGMSLCTINLSGHSMGDPGLYELIAQGTDQHPGLAEKLCFEVTETAAIANLDHAVRFIQSLKRIGVRFALDDFGSGLSSFGYLKTLPVDFLKIDGMFIENIASDPVSRAIVRSINEVAKSMGMRTIAEFVDKPESLRILRKIGVDYAQGYWIGRPRPIEELLAA